MCNNILIILTEIPFSLEKKLKNFRTEISWKFKKNLFAVSLVPLFVDQVVSLVVLLVDLAACSLQLHVFRFKFTANLFLQFLFFWVSPRHQCINVCRRFGTLYQFHLLRQWQNTSGGKVVGCIYTGLGKGAKRGRTNGKEEGQDRWVDT